MLVSDSMPGSNGVFLFRVEFDVGINVPRQTERHLQLVAGITTTSVNLNQHSFPSPVRLLLRQQSVYNESEQLVRFGR